MMRVGVIGLGQIGGAVAECLARSKILAAVYDLNPAAGEGFDGIPPVSSSPADVAELCDVIIIAVVNAEQTVDVLTGSNGALSRSKPGQSILLLSTVSLDDLARIRTLTDRKGAILIDSGVVGSQHARQNGLICLVGAEEKHLTAVQPAFDGFARYVVRMGGPGAGMIGKVIYNGILLSCQRAGYDGAHLANAAGVDIIQLERVFKDSAESVGGPLLLASRPGDPTTGPQEAHWRERMITMMKKDFDAALALGESFGVELPVIRFARETLPTLYWPTH